MSCAAKLEDAVSIPGTEIAESIEDTEMSTSHTPDLLPYSSEIKVQEKKSSEDVASCAGEHRNHTRAPLGHVSMWRKRDRNDVATVFLLLSLYDGIQLS